MLEEEGVQDLLFCDRGGEFYYSKYPYVIRKAVSLGRRCGDIWRHAMIFPLDSMRFFPMIVWNGSGWR